MRRTWRQILCGLLAHSPIARRYIAVPFSGFDVEDYCPHCHQVFGRWRFVPDS